jgi:hypothetical protein
MYGLPCLPFITIIYLGYLLIRHKFLIFFHDLLFICLLFKGVIFECDWRQTILSVKHTQFTSSLFLKPYHLLTQNVKCYVNPQNGHFQGLASLIWHPESLSFNHRLPLLQHGPKYGSNTTMRWSNFISGIWHKGPESITVRKRYNGPCFLRSFLHLHPHILDGAHVRFSRWPVHCTAFFTNTMPQNLLPHISEN